MDLNQLRCVCEVAETGSFSRASENLFLSQPSVSRQIRALEKEYELTIFIRDTHKVTLTAEGRRFVRFAKAVLDSADLLEEEFGTKKKSLELRLVVFPFYGFSSLRQTLYSCLQETHAGTINLVKADTDQALALLGARKADFAFVKVDSIEDNNLNILEIQREKLFLLKRRGDTPETERVTLEQVAALPVHIGYPDERKEGHDSKLAEYFRHGKKSALSLNTSDADVILDMVGSGQGYVLVTEDILENLDQDLFAGIPIVDAPDLVTFLLWNKSGGTGRTYRDFIRYMERISFGQQG